MFSLYFYTIRRLKLTQVVWRCWYFIWSPKIQTISQKKISRPNEPALIGIEKSQTLFPTNKVSFLNTTASLVGHNIWNDTSKSKLWLYNLHYFDDLNSTGAFSRHLQHKLFIERWIKENPPPSGTGWEPYPTSLRIVNWAKWILSGNNPSQSMLDSLATQLNWLEKKIEYHLLGNHILANAKALCFAGLLGIGGAPNKTFDSGMKLFDKQLDEQLLADGGHFELSPMYHALVLEDLLDILSLLRLYNKKIPQIYIRKAESMLAWLSVMTHPDGRIAFFNDSAFKIAPNFDALVNFAKKLGINFKELDPNINHLDASGYVRMDCPESTLLVDVAKVGADYLPGHGHADTLSFELSIQKARVVVNRGVSRYGHSARRHSERSTRAHNTLMLDNQNSSEIWSGFRVARSASVSSLEIVCSEDYRSVVASHDGFRRLPGQPVHERRWNMKPKSLTVSDNVYGSGEHEIEINFYIAPSFSVEKQPNGSVIMNSTGPDSLVVKLESSISDALEVRRSYWHPEFGKAEKINRIVVKKHVTLPADVTHTLTWKI